MVCEPGAHFRLVWSLFSFFFPERGWEGRYDVIDFANLVSNRWREFSISLFCLFLGYYRVTGTKFPLGLDTS